MVSWASPGKVCGYGRLLGSGAGAPRSGFSADLFTLASPGTVDLNGATRFQEYMEDGYSGLLGRASLTFTSGDVSANPGRRLTGVMYAISASQFAPGVVPTPAQIMSAWAAPTGSDPHRQRVFGVSADGVSASSLDAPGTVSLSFIGSLLAWTPNTKVWVLVIPVSYNPATSGDDATAIASANANGRAVSLWTNRTSLAPVILSPLGNRYALPGSDIELTFSPQDPDRVASFPGDATKTDFDDLAGVQVQYAPQATPANPNPVWIDMGFMDTTTPGLVGPGWYIDSTPASATRGAKALWANYTTKIRLGAGSAPAGYGVLPSGDWQIRLRTFDYGHPQVDADNTNPFVVHKPPLNRTPGSLTPNNYPSTNVSPWSIPVNLSITPQVPKPVLLSPINDIALVDQTVVVLRWQYRNTSMPPLAQATRTVQIRQSGTTAWTSLVTSQASSSASLALAGFALVSGNAYEWRVQVTDTSGVQSDWSDVGRFWIVPVPASGAVIPEPGESLDGATLGCGTYTIAVYRRGGLVRTGVLDHVSALEWNRVRDDISTARVVIRGWGVDCGKLLASLETWAYEIVIFRNNGLTTDRVWEGPITLLTYESDQVVIQAKDVMGYTYRRIIRQPMVDSGNSPTAGDTVVNRAARVIQNAFAPDDPNILGYLKILTQADDVKQYRSTPAYARTAFEEVDDMAANAGLDYTAVGRAILVWGTKHRIGTLPGFRDKDLGASPIVSEYGMSMANVYVVSDGNGVHGEANRLNADGKDPIYGLVEMLSSTWASDSQEEAGTYTEAGLETVRKSFQKSAERSIGDRYPPPVIVRVPDNTRLNPDTVISIQHLVPGVVVPLRSTSTLRPVRANQKLDSVKVLVTEGDETISITLSPFSRDDNAVGETE